MMYKALYIQSYFDYKHIFKSTTTSYYDEKNNKTTTNVPNKLFTINETVQQTGSLYIDRCELTHDRAENHLLKCMYKRSRSSAYKLVNAQPELSVDSSSMYPFLIMNS